MLLECELDRDCDLNTFGLFKISVGSEICLRSKFLLKRIRTFLTRSLCSCSLSTRVSSAELFDDGGVVQIGVPCGDGLVQNVHVHFR